MKNVEVSHLTKEYVEFPVEARHDDVVLNPSGFTVKVALMTTGIDPVDADFRPATWGKSQGDDVVRFLFGNTDFTKAVGYYDVWVNIAAGTETPKDKVGVLEVK